MITDRPQMDMSIPYLDRVPNGDLIELFKEQVVTLCTLISGLSEDEAEFRYATGKWSIKEVIGHLIDTERVCCYRLLCAARKDMTPMPSFDENEYVIQGGFHNRTSTDLLAEWKAVRTGTLALLNELTSETLQNEGYFKNRPVKALAIACIILGHANHHIDILHERYKVSQ